MDTQWRRTADPPTESSMRCESWSDKAKTETPTDDAKLFDGRRPCPAPPARRYNVIVVAFRLSRSSAGVKSDWPLLTAATCQTDQQPPATRATGQAEWSPVSPIGRFRSDIANVLSPQWNSLFVQCFRFPDARPPTADLLYLPNPTSEDPILNTKLQNEKNEIGLHYTFLHIRYYGEKIMTDNFRTYILKWGQHSFACSRHNISDY